MIKNLLVLAALSLTVSTSHAAAATPVACPAQISCGTYEGSGAWYTLDNKQKSTYSEKIVLTPLTATSVNIKVYIYGGTIGEPWTDSTLEFDPKSPLGRFTMTSAAGQSFGTGFCNYGTCTLAFAPVDITDETPQFVNTFVDILRFDGNTLKRHNMVVDGMKDSDIGFQRSELTKK